MMDAETKARRIVEMEAEIAELKTKHAGYETHHKDGKPFQAQIADIEIPEGGRTLQEDKVDELAASMRLLGLRVPIAVVVVGPEKLTLIYGRHRLAAARKLGWDQINCVRLPNLHVVDRRALEITENLHRADLTVLERAEQIAEWVELSRQLTEREAKSDERATKCAETKAEQIADATRPFSAQVAPKSPGRPEGGARAAARELGVSRETVSRAQKIAALPAEAKDAAREAGLDDNQTALLEAAKSPDPVASVEQHGQEREISAPPEWVERMEAGTTDPALDALKAAWKEISPDQRKWFEFWSEHLQDEPDAPAAMREIVADLRNAASYREMRKTFMRREVVLHWKNRYLETALGRRVIWPKFTDVWCGGCGDNNISVSVDGSPTLGPSFDDGGLLAIWTGLKRSPAEWGRLWVENLYPGEPHAEEPARVTKALQSFRDAVTEATDEQREDFLTMTAWPWPFGATDGEEKTKDLPAAAD